MPKKQQQQQQQQKQQPKPSLAKVVETDLNRCYHAERDVDQWVVNDSATTLNPKRSRINDTIEFNVPLPNGDGLIIRLREEQRLPSDGKEPYRFVCKFPAPSETAPTQSSTANSRTN